MKHKKRKKGFMERKIIEKLKEKISINQIAKDLFIGKRRVCKIRDMASKKGYLDGSVPMPEYPENPLPELIDKRENKSSENEELIHPHKDWIIERLSSGWDPITVFEEFPIKVHRSSFYRYLQKYEITKFYNKCSKVIQEIVYKMGEALLVDWGKLCYGIDPVTGKRKIVWMFIGILGYSRYLMVRLVWTNSISVTLKALENMFQELGGVPEKIISDNPKCFTKIASIYEPLINPIYERFASYYNTKIECLPPRRPELKGKIENPVSYVRRLYQAYGNKWISIEDSENYLKNKLEMANERTHGTTREKPIERFINEEINFLKPLPSLSYETEDFSFGVIRKDGHVRFRDKYYSVEEKYIGKEVSIIGSSKIISIYFDGRLIETHERLTDRLLSKSTKPNHLKPWERQLKDNSYYRAKASEVGKYTEEMVIKLLEKGNGFIDTRKIWGILSLVKKYDYSIIDESCKMALSMKQLGYRVVKNLADLLKSKQIAPEKGETRIMFTDNKFVRSMSEYSDNLILLKKRRLEK